MWSSAQCGPDPFKASLQAIHQQQALADQSRLSIGGEHALFPPSTASSRPLSHQTKPLRPQLPHQQRTAVPSWTDEYARSQHPSNGAFHPQPVHSASASSWLTEYTSFHTRPTVLSAPAITPFSVDEYNRTLTQQSLASRTQHNSSIPSAVVQTRPPSRTHIPPPISIARPASSALPECLPPSYVPALPVSSASSLASSPSLPSTSAHFASSPVVSSTSSIAIQSVHQSSVTPSHTSTATHSPIASRHSTVSSTAVRHTPAQSATHQPSTVPTSEAECRALEAARLHDAVYNDEHELSDTDFIHNGQWQHFTTQHYSPPTPTHPPLGLSTHILHGMYDTTPQHPQQRYTASDVEAIDKTGQVKGEVSGVAVDVLEVGNEWDANGRVWDWVVRERQMEDAENEQRVGGGLNLGGDKSMAVPVATGAMAGVADVDEMDVLLKEFYL